MVLTYIILFSLIVHFYEWHLDWIDCENWWVEMMLAAMWCLANRWTLVLDDTFVYMKLLWGRKHIMSALQDWIWQSFQKTFIARCVSLKKRCQDSELVLQIPQSRSDPLHRWSMRQDISRRYGKSRFWSRGRTVPPQKMQLQ